MDAWTPRSLTSTYGSNDLGHEQNQSNCVCKSHPHPEDVQRQASDRLSNGILSFLEIYPRTRWRSLIHSFAMWMLPKRPRYATLIVTCRMTSLKRTPPRNVEFLLRLKCSSWTWLGHSRTAKIYLMPTEQLLTYKRRVIDSSIIPEIITTAIDVRTHSHSFLILFFLAHSVTCSYLLQARSSRIPNSLWLQKSTWWNNLLMNSGRKSRLMFPVNGMVQPTSEFRLLQCRSWQSVSHYLPMVATFATRTKLA